MSKRRNYTVNVSRGLNLREEPSMDAKILKVLPDGTKVKVDPEANTPDGWAAIETGGFVVSSYLK